MADSDNLTQFMQATAYVRFKPDTEERSTYLYRAYTKWCEDNLESPVPQKKFSQFLLKNAGKYGLTFSKHIEGTYRGFRGVCVHPAFAAA
jgi:putative DNA primase/helicase